MLYMNTYTVHMYAVLFLCFHFICKNDYNLELWERMYIVYIMPVKDILPVFDLDDP